VQETKAQAGARLQNHLEAVRRVRAQALAAPASRKSVMLLRHWQAERLARTYPDLLANPRYHAPARFFFEELYGPKDFSRRDADLLRILPKMQALLPAAALSTVADAVELDGLSERLDAALLAQLGHPPGSARALPPAALTDASYARAYRACANSDQRARQIEFVAAIGADLDGLTRVPLLDGTIRMMGTPARLAGLAGLHEFLATGFSTFKKMGGATEFIGTIVGRETVLMKRLFEGAPDPFGGLVRAGPFGGSE
jgi:hypothetical protein